MKIKRLLASFILGLGLTLVFLWLLAAGSLVMVRADTFTVDTTDDSGPGSLRQAIIDANVDSSHDTIGLNITGTIVLESELPQIGGSLTITGPGAELLAISGANTHRVFYIKSGAAVTITGVTVRDGRTDNKNGGGIWSAGTLHLDSVRVVSNTVSDPEFSWYTKYGGGVYVDSGSVTMNGTQVVSNSAYGGGGVYVSSGSATLDVNGGRIDNNSATDGGSGGGVGVGQGSATLSGTQVANNSAYNGGGVYVGDGSVTLSGTQVVSNSVPNGGGGVAVMDSNATLNVNGGVIGNNSTSSYGGGVFVGGGSVTLSGTQVSSNSAYNGGGVCMDSGSVTLSGAHVISNSASKYGGGVYGNVMLIGTQVAGNSASADGGGVYGGATLSGTQVVGNSASGNGGGVYVFGIATLIETQVAGNSASGDGGGVYASSSVILNETQVVSNEATYGGGVYVRYKRVILNVSGGRIDGNSTTNDGGGVYVFEGYAMLNEVQVVGNSTSGGSGGGVYVDSDIATLNVSGGGIDGNEAFYSGGGVGVDQGSVTLSGTQVSSNEASLSGGGLVIFDGSVTLSETQVVGNSAAKGGGVAVVNANATLNVSGGGIDGNSASEQGGGVYVYDGSATLNETQVVSNSAKNGGGVGVWGGSATLNGTQVLGNSADNGGGIDLFGNGTIVAADGCIVFNSDVAVDGALTAMDNWWGTPDGPGGMGPGSGDTVGAGVNYDNFKIEAPPGCPSRPFFDPEITVAPTTLDFGIRDVHAGATVSQTVTITNEGNADLHISAVITTGDAAEFNLFGNSAITVMEGGVHTIEVSFDPSSGGMKVVTLTIESDDRDEAAVTVVLSGTGWAQPGYGSDPAPGSSIEVGIEVGTVSVGNTVYSRLAISETGNMTLTVTPTLSGADEADFGFTPSTLTILNGEAAQDLIISCTPMAVRTFVATLTVAHNAPDSPAVYSLSCIGEEDYIYLPLVLRSE